MIWTKIVWNATTNKYIKTSNKIRQIKLQSVNNNSEENEIDPVIKAWKNVQVKWIQCVVSSTMWQNC